MKPDLQTILQKNRDEVLKSLGFGDMPEADKGQAMEQLEDHFSKIIIETLIVNLNDDLLSEFRQAFENPAADMEQIVMELSAQVPGLTEKIETAVKEEFMILASAKRVIDTP